MRILMCVLTFAGMLFASEAKACGPVAFQQVQVFRSRAFFVQQAPSFQFQSGRRGVQFQQSGGVGQNIQFSQQRRGLLGLRQRTVFQSSGPAGNVQFIGR